MSVVEADILTRVIAPDDASLEKKVAEAVLAKGFKAADRRRMDELADKAREGCLSADERVEADSYERIGHFRPVSVLTSDTFHRSRTLIVAA
jgi:hypothetical protein